MRKWKRAASVFVVLIIALLNVAMVMSDLQIFARRGFPHDSNLIRLIVFYSALLLFDVTLLIPRVIECWSIEVTDGGLVVRTMLSKKRFDWEEITEFKNVPWMYIVVLRARKCFYFINRKDIQRFNDLSKIVTTRACPPRIP